MQVNVAGLDYWLYAAIAIATPILEISTQHQVMLLHMAMIDCIFNIFPSLSLFADLHVRV